MVLKRFIVSFVAILGMSGVASADWCSAPGRFCVAIAVDPTVSLKRESLTVEYHYSYTEALHGWSSTGSGSTSFYGFVGFSSDHIIYRDQNENVPIDQFRDFKFVVDTINDEKA